MIITKGHWERKRKVSQKEGIRISNKASVNPANHFQWSWTLSVSDRISCGWCQQGLWCPFLVNIFHTRSSHEPYGPDSRRWTGFNWSVKGNEVRKVGCLQPPSTTQDTSTGGKQNGVIAWFILDCVTSRVTDWLPGLMHCTCVVLNHNPIQKNYM